MTKPEEKSEEGAQGNGANKEHSCFGECDQRDKNHSGRKDKAHGMRRNNADTSGPKWADRGFIQLGALRDSLARMSGPSGNSLFH